MHAIQLEPALQFVHVEFTREYYLGQTVHAVFALQLRSGLHLVPLFLYPPKQDVHELGLELKQPLQGCSHCFTHEFPYILYPELQVWQTFAAEHVSHPVLQSLHEPDCR